MILKVASYARVSLKNVLIFFKWKDLFKCVSVTKDDPKDFMVPLLCYLFSILMLMWVLYKLPFMSETQSFASEFLIPILFFSEIIFKPFLIYRFWKLRKEERKEHKPV